MCFKWIKGWAVKVFDIITKINKVKTLVKHTSSDRNANSIVQHANQIINAIVININASVKWKVIIGIRAHVFVRTVVIWKVLSAAKLYMSRIVYQQMQQMLY